MIVLVIRTRRPFLRSRPGNGLFLATVGIVAVDSCAAVHTDWPCFWISAATDVVSCPADGDRRAVHDQRRSREEDLLCAPVIDDRMTWPMGSHNGDSVVALLRK